MKTPVGLIVAQGEPPFFPKMHCDCGLNLTNTHRKSQHIEVWCLSLHLALSHQNPFNFAPNFHSIPHQISFNFAPNSVSKIIQFRTKFSFNSAPNFHSILHQISFNFTPNFRSKIIQFRTKFSFNSAPKFV